MKVVCSIVSVQKAAGTSTFCREVCNRLVELGHDVIVVLGDPNGADVGLFDERIEVYSFTDFFRANLNLMPVDILHIHGIWSIQLHQMNVWASKRQVPVVWSTHGMTAPWALHHKWYKKFLPWFLYQKRDLRRANLIHCTSQIEVDWNHDLGFQATDIVPLGTDIPPLNMEFQSASSDRRRVLLFVGRIYPVKALDNLICAFSLVPVEMREGWQLRLVGPDQAGHMDDLKAVCRKIGLTFSASQQDYEACTADVVFAGPRYGEELKREYLQCDCLALVSHTENFGATALDAMAYARPIITSRGTPWKEVQDLNCGWWVDNEPKVLSKALCDMMSIPDAERYRKGIIARDLVVEKYSWSAVTERMIACYRRAVNG